MIAVWKGVTVCWPPAVALIVSLISTDQFF